MSTINLKTNYQLVGYAEKKQYITSPVRYSTISSEDLIKYACENSGIPKAQMAAAFYAINQQIEQFVLNGHGLELGTLGTFYLSARTKATDTEEEAGANAVIRLGVKFRQSKRMKKLLAASVTLSTVNWQTESSEAGSDSTDSGTTDSEEDPFG